MGDAVIMARIGYSSAAPARRLCENIAQSAASGYNKPRVSGRGGVWAPSSPSGEFLRAAERRTDRKARTKNPNGDRTMRNERGRAWKCRQPADTGSVSLKHIMRRTGHRVRLVGLDWNGALLPGLRQLNSRIFARSPRAATGTARSSAKTANGRRRTGCVQ